MTEDEAFKAFAEMTAQHAKFMRRCLLLESVGIAVTLIGCGACALIILRPGSTTLMRGLNLAAFAINMSVCRNAVFEWRRSRRLLRQIAECSDWIELERIARL